MPAFVKKIVGPRCEYAYFARSVLSGIIWVVHSTKTVLVFVLS